MKCTPTNHIQSVRGTGLPFTVNRASPSILSYLWIILCLLGFSGVGSGAFSVLTYLLELLSVPSRALVEIAVPQVKYLVFEEEITSPK